MAVYLQQSVLPCSVFLLPPVPQNDKGLVYREPAELEVKASVVKWGAFTNGCLLVRLRM